jgi:hypothetical protein
MKTAKSILLCFLILQACTVMAQQTQKPLNSLSLGLFRYQSIAESKNFVKAPQFIPGVYYERVLRPKLSLLGGLEISSGIIKDRCEFCVDKTVGIAKLKELTLLAGARYYFSSRTDRYLRPFLQMDLSYGISSYSGDFSSGWTGRNEKLNNVFHKYSSILRFGIDIRPLKNLTITPMISYRLGYLSGKDNARPPIPGNLTDYWNFGSIPFEIRIGLRF